MFSLKPRLADKVAIVTGGAKGIGQAFCVGLAREGAKVVIADIADSSSTAEKVNQVLGEALILTVDVTSESSTESMARKVMDKYGHIDILVNNAGIYPTMPFKDMTFNDWKKVLAVNLDGLFLTTRAVYPYMIAQKSGRIVNISSGTFFRGTPNMAHYVTTKAGAIGFTRTLATEAGEYGITVNAIAPGLVATQTVLDGPQAKQLESTIQLQSLKRRQEPEDLVGTLLYLVTDEGAFVTGQTLAVNGGLAKY
jgi:NAD(P)-dependent dehydrogenase (short-subunit alcohol dehydrogenase family)